MHSSTEEESNQKTQSKSNLSQHIRALSLCKVVSCVSQTFIGKTKSYLDKRTIL